jgi:Asp-tRNA(Asn)/Glu-tRNA(Gln) amidotransferase C subunit
MIDERDVKRLAELAGLEIDPAFLPGVTRNLETLVGQAALLMAPPLAAEIEPAPVFRP